MFLLSRLIFVSVTRNWFSIASDLLCISASHRNDYYYSFNACMMQPEGLGTVWDSAKPLERSCSTVKPQELWNRTNLTKNCQPQHGCLPRKPHIIILAIEEMHPSSLRSWYTRGDQQCCERQHGICANTSLTQILLLPQSCICDGQSKVSRFKTDLPVTMFRMQPLT
jgi:hypothetical protein